MKPKRGALGPASQPQPANSGKRELASTIGRDYPHARGGYAAEAATVVPIPRLATRWQLPHHHIALRLSLLVRSPRVDRAPVGEEWHIHMPRFCAGKST